MQSCRAQTRRLRDVYIGPGKPLVPGIVGGFSVIELMVAMVITLVVTLITISIAASVFQANTQSIYMIQLTQEMRSAIQLISRDIRRSGYNDDSLASFLATEAIGSGVTMGSLDADNIANCLQVQYDDLNGNAINVVYRLRVISSVGRVSAHFDANATCDTSLVDDNWVDVSDPLLTHVSALEFVLSEQLTDIAENLTSGNVIQVGVEGISIVISANLRANDTVSRSIINAVQVRNQYLTV